MFLTLLADLCPDDRDIYCNFSLEYDNATKVSVEDLETINEGLLLIDEGYIWLDSRLSQSNLNKYLSTFIFQSRKRGFDIFMSAQLESSLDLRFRHLQDLKVFCSGLKEVRVNTEKKEAFEYLLGGWGNVKKFYLPLEYAKRNLFDKFDTTEFPETEVTKFEPKKWNKIIDKWTDFVEENYGNNDDITRGMIEDILIEQGCSNSDVHDAVYDRLKRRRVLE